MSEPAAVISMPVPAPSLAHVIVAKIRDGATLEETQQYYKFLREIEADEAQRAAAAAFVAMQGALPEITRHGRIEIGRGRPQQYARWEDINETIRPILREHGFALSFDIVEETDTQVIVQANLIHRNGHVRSTRKKLPLDRSGSKNITQSYGSTQSYAQRYAAIALLNITSRNEDDDGNGGNAKATGELLSAAQISHLQDRALEVFNDPIKRMDQLLVAVGGYRSLEQVPADKYDLMILKINQFEANKRAAQGTDNGT